MFVTKARLDRVVEYHARELQRVESRLWSLQHKYDRLMEKLGLVEHEVPARIVLSEKGAPEPSDG